MTGRENKRQAEKASKLAGPVRLRFTGEGTIAIKGPVTGKTYLASESTREIDVDPRDAEEFIQNGIFVRASSSFH
jgi:hypothetical protein